MLIYFKIDGHKLTIIHSVGQIALWKQYENVVRFDPAEPLSYLIWLALELRPYEILWRHKISTADMQLLQIFYSNALLYFDCWNEICIYFKILFLSKLRFLSNFVFHVEHISLVGGEDFTSTSFRISAQASVIKVMGIR